MKVCLSLLWIICVMLYMDSGKIRTSKCIPSRILLIITILLGLRNFSLLDFQAISLSIYIYVFMQNLKQHDIQDHSWRKTFRRSLARMINYHFQFNHPRHTIPECLYPNYFSRFSSRIVPNSRGNSHNFLDFYLIISFFLHMFSNLSRENFLVPSI